MPFLLILNGRYCIAFMWRHPNLREGFNYQTDDAVMTMNPMRLLVMHLSSVYDTTGLAMDCGVGLRWHFHCGCPFSKPRPVLDFSSEKSGVVFIFFKVKI